MKNIVRVYQIIFVVILYQLEIISNNITFRKLNQFHDFIFNSITVEPEPIVGCEDNDDCSSNEACRNQDCINPCVIPRNPCSNPATCSVNNHQPICTCPPGYEENAYGQCTPGKYLI